jgi:RNA polymerase sigma-70 factor (ECF subfamily)
VRAERRRVVLDALATLPEEQRAALVLVDMEGYPVAEAAQMLDCAVGTVKSRCSRGRARLAVLLADLMGQVDGTPHPDARNRPVPPPVQSAQPSRAPPLDS